MSLFKTTKSKVIEIGGIEIGVFSLTIKKMIDFQALQARIEKDPTAILAMLELLHTLIDQSVQAVTVEDLADMSVIDLTDLIKNVTSNN